MAACSDGDLVIVSIFYNHHRNSDKDSRIWITKISV